MQPRIPRQVATRLSARDDVVGAEAQRRCLDPHRDKRRVEVVLEGVEEGSDGTGGGEERRVGGVGVELLLGAGRERFVSG